MKQKNPPLHLTLIIAMVALAASCTTVTPDVESYPAENAHRVSINGTEIHYFDYPALSGEPEDTPIVYIHGFSGTGFEASFIRDYLGTDRRIIAPDLPGSGYSEKPDIEYSLEYFTDFVRDFIGTLEIDRYVLVGHSMGGMISIDFASTLPEGLERLVLIAPYGLPGEAGRVVDFLAETGLLVDYGMTLHNETLMRAAIQTQVFKNADRIPPDYVDYLASATFDTENAIPALASITRNVITDHLDPEVLASICCPTLIIWGADDRVLHFSYAAQFNRAIPRSELQAIPDCGHLPHVEWPEVTASIILEFLESDR
jgi:pimeloyl-ACP methyl ester carboxylesterase